MADQTESRPKACCRHIKNFFTLNSEGATPINWSILSTVVIALFGSAYSITFLFPFLPEMILEFGYAEEDKGYYAGFVASGMFAGRAFGSFFWGWLSDRYGRRPIMLITTVFVGLSSVAFGFSTNLYMAIFMRFLTGLFNGLVGTCKTVLYEISDNTNQAAGMSGIAMAWGSGVVLGPFISGFLALPAKKYPSVFPKGSLFDMFPFLLPSLVAGLMSVVGFVAVFWKLPETLDRKRKESEVVVESLLENPDESHKDVLPTNTESQADKDMVQITVTKSKSTTFLDVPRALNSAHEHSNKSPCVLRKTALSKSTGYLHSGAKYEDAYDIYGLGQPLNVSQQILHQSRPSLTKSTTSLPDGKTDLKNGVISRNGVVENYKSRFNDSAAKATPVEIEVIHINGDSPAVKIVPSNDAKESKQHCCFRLKHMTLCRLLREKDVLISVFLYTGMSFAVIGWEELFVVWASTEKRLGGLSLNSGKIGAAVGGSSTGLLFIQVFLYPKLVSRFGTMRVFQFSMVYLVIVSAVVPCMRYVDNTSLALWIPLLLMLGVQKLCVTSAFSSVSIFINNSVPPCDAGSVNGVGMTFAALSRTLAPCVSGSMFAWSITEGVKIGFPLDVNMAFIFLSAVYLIINICSAFAPRRLEKQKKPESE